MYVHTYNTIHAIKALTWAQLWHELLFGLDSSTYGYRCLHSGNLHRTGGGSRGVTSAIRRRTTFLSFFIFLPHPAESGMQRFSWQFAFLCSLQSLVFFTMAICLLLLLSLNTHDHLLVRMLISQAKVVDCPFGLAYSGHDVNRDRSLFSVALLIEYPVW